MKARSRAYLAISMVIIFTMCFSGIPVRAQNGPAEDRTGGADKGVSLILQADSAPAPGGTAHLTMQATPLLNAPQMEIKWVIPDGVQLLNGELDTFEDVVANQPLTSERDLRFPASGTYKIGVSVILRMAPEETHGTSSVLFFVIDPGNSYVTDMDPNAQRPVRHSRPGEVAITSAPANTGVNFPNEDPCFTISAHFDRIERPVTLEGFGQEYRIPLVGAEVEFRESDLISDDSYGTLATDSNGNVTGSFCDDDGIFDDTLEIYLRLTATRGDPAVYVEDSSYIDEIYEYDTDWIESDGGWIEFNVNLGYDWSGIFNIIDVAILARQLWVDSGGSFPDETEIHWEDGYGDDKSYYNSYYNEITIADDPSDPDQWDDAIFIHEWGHFADDLFSCDDNPGGDHAPGEELDPELAWGEGYPTYYSSAVRDTYGYEYARYMIDIDGNGYPANQYDLDAYNYPISTNNQGSISAALWDLYDSEGYDDRAEYGHVPIQAVYVSSEFNDVAYGLFDNTCDFDTYMRGWVDSGQPTDRNTAAAVKMNTGYTLLPSKAGGSANGSTTNGYTPAEVYRWWKQLTYVGDNSHSMDGPKFNAMKVLFEEAVNDFGNDPEGTEFTLELFNNTTSDNDIEFAGQFFPEDLINPINALVTIPYADPNCEVSALRALAQAADDKEKGDIWLFTDGDTLLAPSTQVVREVLTENQLRASIALMGLCAKGENTALMQPFSFDMLEGLSLEEQQTLMGERLAIGDARSQLGTMATLASTGVVPYMLTALNSGGQFLYVDSSQVDDAADILRAQITNSAGAGNWSDYVSDQPTYIYDTLASWEYSWINARLGTNRGNPLPNQRLYIPLPGGHYFQYFSGDYYSAFNVFEDGYVTLGNSEAYVYNNTTLPNPAVPNNALYPFWDNILPYCPPGEGGVPEECVGFIYTIEQGDWYVVEYYQYETLSSHVLNNFEILFNLQTGEIRYQYELVPEGAPGATIGLENSTGTNGFQLSYNDANGADNSMGYKFVPAPPQPTRTHIVPVDSTMEAVGFLLTGYSGTFEPMRITDPNGDLVNCADPGTQCLDLDLVQYVQVNTNGRIGDWQAVVDAGPSGLGTYSFTSFATSPLAVESSSDHTLVLGTQQLAIRMSGGVDGNLLSGHFHKANGDAFGGSFNFYDDGLHNDGLPGDGLFGSGNFTPPSLATAYLTLQGLHHGESFTRLDTRPYTFAPFEMTSLGDKANYGGVTQVSFSFKNRDAYDHCYWLLYSAPEGWWIDFTVYPAVCLAAGETKTVAYDVYMTDGYSNILPSGTTGILTMSAIEAEKGAFHDSASARITRHRQPYKIEIFNPTKFLRPNGDQAVLEFRVTDIQGVNVADGTEIQLITNNGDIYPFEHTINGSFASVFTSGPYIATALIMAQTSNGSVSASTEIEIGNPLPDDITLWLSTNQLPADGSSSAQVVATVRDFWGNPVANQLVKIGIESDDMQLGSLGGQETVTGYTDANGRLSAVFTNAGVAGKLGINAELLIIEGGNQVVAYHDRKVMYIGITFTHLPLIRHK